MHNDMNESYIHNSSFIIVCTKRVSLILKYCTTNMLGSSRTKYGSYFLIYRSLYEKSLIGTGSSCSKPAHNNAVSREALKLVVSQN